VGCSVGYFVVEYPLVSVFPREISFKSECEYSRNFILNHFASVRLERNSSSVARSLLHSMTCNCKDGMAEGLPLILVSANGTYPEAINKEINKCLVTNSSPPFLPHRSGCNRELHSNQVLPPHNCRSH